MMIVLITIFRLIKMIKHERPADKQNMRSQQAFAKRITDFDNTGRGDPGEGLQGEGVRAEEGELLPQRQLWLRHPGAH